MAVVPARVVLTAVALLLPIAAGVALLAPRTESPPAAAPSIADKPEPPGPYLDDRGRAELGLVRRATARQAAAVVAVAHPCLTRHRRRSVDARNCAFRPMVAAAAAQSINGQILAGVDGALTPGTCRQHVRGYSGLISEFALSARAAAQTGLGWAQTRAGYLALDQLAQAVRRAATSPTWDVHCRHDARA
jgi:hypothetical protein